MFVEGECGMRTSAKRKKAKKQLLDFCLLQDCEAVQRGIIYLAKQVKAATSILLGTHF